MEKESEREKEGMPGLKGRLLLSIHHCHLLALAGQIASDRKKNKKTPNWPQIIAPLWPLEVVRWEVWLCLATCSCDSVIQSVPSQRRCNAPIYTWTEKTMSGAYSGVVLFTPSAQNGKTHIWAVKKKKANYEALFPVKRDAGIHCLVMKPVHSCFTLLIHLELITFAVKFVSDLLRFKLYLQNLYGAAKPPPSAS